MSTTLRRSSSAATSQAGRYIFAYCNIRTHQVLYSLQKELKDEALKQLPDLGANSVPPTIRQDSWKPLWTLVYGDHAQGFAHGEQAFQKLQEWKILHEYNTTPPPENSKTWSPEQIDELQEKLDKRGGSKITTVWKQITREKKKARIKNVMDQKNNSIADLAAVLMEQHAIAVKHSKGWQDRRELEIQSMIAQSERPMNFVHGLKARLAAVAGQLSSTTEQRPGQDRLTKTELLIEQQRILGAIEFIRSSIQLVENARLRLQHEQPTLPTKLIADNEDGKDIVEQQDDAQTSTTDVESATSRERAKVDSASMKPPGYIQDTLSPSAAIGFLLNRRFFTHHRLLTTDSLTTPPSTVPVDALRWQNVEHGIMSAQDFDSLIQALRPIKARGLVKDIVKAVGSLRDAVAARESRLQAVIDERDAMLKAAQEAEIEKQEEEDQEEEHEQDHEPEPEPKKRRTRLWQRLLSETTFTSDAEKKAFLEGLLARFQSIPNTKSSLSDKAKKQIKIIKRRISDLDRRQARLAAAGDEYERAARSEVSAAVAEETEQAARSEVSAAVAEEDEPAYIAEEEETVEESFSTWVADPDTHLRALLRKEVHAMDLSPYLPSPSLRYIPTDQLPKNDAEAARVKKEFAPINMLTGARVQWQNALDAEIARAWPASIDHVYMGVTEHEAPDPHAPALQDTIDFADRVAIKQQFNALREAEAAEARGLHEEARALRAGVKSIRKNRQGHYELVDVEQRRAALVAQTA